mmetsp:Transcript_113456/g.367010  ORF Transcript_113456/g.367010 Transcript_113456/m.367010 type:complete len:583 (-) Transcript_113456:48-1796(-)
MSSSKSQACGFAFSLGASGKAMTSSPWAKGPADKPRKSSSSSSSVATPRFPTSARTGGNCGPTGRQPRKSPSASSSNLSSDAGPSAGAGAAGAADDDEAEPEEKEALPPPEEELPSAELAASSRALHRRSNTLSSSTSLSAGGRSFLGGEAPPPPSFGGALRLAGRKLGGGIPEGAANAEEAAEAEEAEAEAAEQLELVGPVGQDGKPMATPRDEAAKATRSEPQAEAEAVVARCWIKGGRSTPVMTAVLLLLFCLLCRVLLLLPASQLPEDLGYIEVPQSFMLQMQVPLATAVPKAHKKPGASGSSGASASTPSLKPDKTTTASGLPTAMTAAAVEKVRNVVISCNEKRLARFQRLMARSGLTFDVAPCIKGSSHNIRSAVRDNLIGAGSIYMATGLSSGGRDRSQIMGDAISNLRLLQNISVGDATVVNIFSDREVVWQTYKERRFELLTHLPDNLDMVKMNVKQPAGRKVKIPRAGIWMQGNVFRMHSTLSPIVNVGMSNYIVTKQSAAKIVKWSRGFDSAGKWETLDQFLLSKFYKESRKRGHFVAFTVTTSLLSVRCEERVLAHTRKEGELCRLDAT